MSSVEVKQRITVFGISLIVGFVFLVVMSVLFTGESKLGIFLLDRATPYYPFTVQNIMWLMFWVGWGELWVRFYQSRLEGAQISEKYLPEDDESMLRAQDLGSYYRRVRPVEGGTHFLFTAFDHALYFTISGQSIRRSGQLITKFFSGIISARTRTQVQYAALSHVADPNIGFYWHDYRDCGCAGVCGRYCRSTGPRIC